MKKKGHIRSLEVKRYTYLLDSLLCCNYLLCFTSNDIYMSIRYGMTMNESLKMGQMLFQHKFCFSYYNPLSGHS